MKYARHGHSACGVGEKYIVVTGGRIGDGNTCEIYDVGLNKWSDLPRLNTKRHYHSSCAFENSSVFAFCGINCDNRAYVNTIERLDISMFHQNVITHWEVFTVSSGSLEFTARQGLGSCQIDAQGILLVGGYTGEHTKDSFYLNVGDKTLSKAGNQLPINTFPFAVPTLGEV
jgi:hypothetical protein